MAVKKNESVDKNKALENAIKQITKDFGEGSIMKLGENAAMANYKSDEGVSEFATVNLVK